MRGCHAVPYECLNMGHNLNWERTWISLSSKLDNKVVQYFKSTVHEKIQIVFVRIVFHEHKRANVKIIKKIWNNFSLPLSNRYFHIFMEFPQDYLLWLYEANRRTCAWHQAAIRISIEHSGVAEEWIYAVDIKKHVLTCWLLLQKCGDLNAKTQKNPAEMSDWDLSVSLRSWLRIWYGKKLHLKNKFWRYTF